MKIRVPLGTYPKAEAERIRKKYNAERDRYSQRDANRQNGHMQFRGRGKRVHIIDGKRRYFQDSLPLKYASSVAIYLVLDVDIKSEIRYATQRLQHKYDELKGSMIKIKDFCFNRVIEHGGE
jgi:hypothetical protein